MANRQHCMKANHQFISSKEIQIPYEALDFHWLQTRWHKTVKWVIFNLIYCALDSAYNTLNGRRPGRHFLERNVLKKLFIHLH